MVAVQIAVVERRPRLTNRLARSISKDSQLLYHWLPLADDQAAHVDRLKSNRYGVLVVRILAEEVVQIAELIEERHLRAPMLLVSDVTADTEFLLRDLGVATILPFATTAGTIHKAVENLVSIYRAPQRLDSR